MNDIVIEAEHIAKSFKLGSKVAYGRASEFLENLAKAPFRRIRRKPDSGHSHPANADNQTLWALNDLSFSVRRGEVVGLIGRNGAGKSTLLKILARITEPTRGRIRLKGRVGSLLEVGTGFHPELTGRENIFLNGAILGMTRREIRAAFDDIVTFAEVERFLDTPVKRYSSGMYMRLAFAVAAHLTPEILLVDEVLAVGDAAFQKKCLGKMSDVARGGRTVIFVSHNMAAIENLCDSCLLLDAGRVAAFGDTRTVTEQYMATATDVAASQFTCDVPPNPRGWITNIHFENLQGQPTAAVLMSEPLNMCISYELAQAMPCSIDVQISEMSGSPVYHFVSSDVDFTLPADAGRHTLNVRLPPLHLYPGEYAVVVHFSHYTGGHHDPLQKVAKLMVNVEQDHHVVARPLSRRAALLFLPADWSVKA